MAVRIIDRKWYVDIRDNIGKRHRLKSPENSKKGALAYERLLLGRISRNEPLRGVEDQKSPLFKDFAQQWLKSYVASNNKPSVQTTKREIIGNHLTPFFGARHIDQITGWMIEQFKTKKQSEGLAPKTVNNILTVLRTCLNHAHEWELIEKPIKIKPVKCPEPKTKYLSRDELSLLLSDTEAGMWNDMILIATHTGMRFGELCGLHWEDVELDTKTIYVRRALVRKLLTTPKSGKKRAIPMSDAVVKRLKQMRRQGKFVFMREDGREITKGMGLPELHKICDRVGIQRVGWHTLRHTFATMLVEGGESLRVIQKLLGHSTIRMTERYSHVPDSSLTKAVQKLDSIQFGESLGSIWAVDFLRETETKIPVGTKAYK